MSKLSSSIILSLALVIVACSSNPPAPVIDRVSTSNNNNSNKPNTPNTPSKKTSHKNESKPADWRPDSYTVKKGDTLISIGLEFGYDYKDIAQNNDISAPYTIKVGQSLKLKSTKDKLVTIETKLDQGDGVSTFPLNGSANNTSSSLPQSASIAQNTPSLSSPKAIREPYSDEALNKAPPLGQTIAEKSSSSPISAKITTANSAETKASTEATDDIQWAWPTKGKVSETFNETSNKGIDIAGASGQSISAAASGKVIYSGSDLRGYGKLVIIKHNANYLSVYAHNKTLLVKEGQQVSSGQKIAEMGDTDADKIGLHFEIRHLGKSVDPSKYLGTN